MSWGDQESAVVSRLQAKLHRHALANQTKWDYYDGEAGLKNLGIAIPESLVNVQAVVGWPEVVVDALAERLEWQGWRSHSDISDLERVFTENQLDAEVHKAVLDALVTGVGFLAVSKGGAGEPQVIINAVPSTRATFEWDERLNRMAHGYVLEQAVDGTRFETLYFPDRTVTRISRDGDEEFVVDEHGLGRCALIALPNRARSESSLGRSEITSAIRYYTDHGVRTILGMEYNREFYTTPQRYLTNVVPEQLGASEEPTSGELVELGWKVAMNKALIIPPGDPEDGDGQPGVGEFSSASPTPYIDELKMLAQLVSAQSGVPASYLGFVSDNPASADAIRASEARLVKKAEDRQRVFGHALRELAVLCASALGLPAVVDVLPVWRDASTPTVAATMDAMVKAVQAGIFPAGSEVIWDRLGVTEAEKQVLRRERSVQLASARLAALDMEVGNVAVEPVSGGIGLDAFVSGGDSSGF